jgi:doublecortin-like kinase 3
MYPRGRGPQGQVYPGKNFLSQSDDIYNKPKVVTVVRNGDKPRNIVKILLNKRSVQSYEQLMSDISESFGPKWKNNRVRKLFTVRGKEVQSISDFFRNDDLFIAVGTEPLSVSDVADILKEVAPDSTQAKNFKKDLERQKLKKQDVEKIGDLQEGEREDKRDSGFGENDEDKDEVIYIPQKHDPVRTRRKKPKEVPPPSETLTEHEKNIVSHLDTERKKAADEDRLRTKKRIQKMEEAEKRALDEERRKRGLVPQKGTKDDPYRKMLEEREKEREKQREAEKERARKKREKEERRRQVMEEKEMVGDADERDRQKEEEERKRKEERKRRMEEKKKREEERRQEEEAEQEERRKLEENRAEERRKEEEQKRKEVEDARKQEKEKEEKRKKEEERIRRIEEEQRIKGANSARIVDQTKRADDRKTPDEKVEETKEEEEAKDSGVGDEVDSTKETKKAASSKNRKVELEEKEDSSTSPKRRGSKQVDSADKHHKRRDSVKDKENKTEDDNNNNQKVRPLVEKKENAPRKRSTRTHRTKFDRQVSNAERVLDRYEVGKVMGDGNFAVVKACKLKNTNNEYAMKIIDKSKLKGKEHMIENEIEIMKRCTHPNIVRLKEEFETKEEIYLIMELVKVSQYFIIC